MFRLSLALLAMCVVLPSLGAAPIVRRATSPKAVVRARKAFLPDKRVTMQFRGGVLKVKNGWFGRYDVPLQGAVKFKRHGQTIKVTHKSHTEAVMEVAGLGMKYVLKERSGAWTFKGTRQTWGRSWGDARVPLTARLGRSPLLRWLPRIRNIWGVSRVVGFFSHPIRRAVGWGVGGLRLAERTRLLGNWFGRRGHLPTGDQAPLEHGYRIQDGAVEVVTHPVGDPGRALGQLHEINVTTEAVAGEKPRWMRFWTGMRPWNIFTRMAHSLEAATETE